MVRERGEEGLRSPHNDITRTILINMVIGKSRTIGGWVHVNAVAPC